MVYPLKWSPVSFRSSAGQLDKESSPTKDRRATVVPRAIISASLNVAGKRPLRSEQLNSSTMNGATISVIYFNTDVGTGLADDDLSGSRQPKKYADLFADLIDI